MLYIATLAEVKGDLGIEDAKDDAVLTRHLEGLQGRLDAHCNRYFLQGSDVAENHDGGARWLLVKRWPIATVAHVYVDTDQEWNAASELETDEYRIDAVRGRLGYGTGDEAWPAGMQNIRVVYTGGFFTSAGAACSGVEEGDRQAVKGAYLLQAGFEWRHRTRLGEESVSAGGATVSLAPAELLPEVKKVLARFERI